MSDLLPPDRPKAQRYSDLPGESEHRLIDKRYGSLPDRSDLPIDDHIWEDDLSGFRLGRVSYPEETTRYERVKNVLSNTAYDAVERFRNASNKTRAAVIGAVVVGLLGGGLGAKEGYDYLAKAPSLIASAEDAKDYISDDSEQKAQDLNKDPLFRATTVSLMRNGSLMGSGSLVKVDDEYKLATVEHVVASIYGLEEFNSAGGGVEISGGTEDGDDEYSFFVPGVGVVELSEDIDDVEFLGGADAANDRKDRLAYISIGSGAQAEIEKAEKDETLKVPEMLTNFEAEVGDIFYMPLADTGEKIPLFYVGDLGGITFAPVILFSETLDIEEAKASLHREVDYDIERQRQFQEDSAAEVEAEGGTYIPSEPDIESAAWAATNSRANEFALEHYQEEFAEGNLGVTAWLPCMGDSGSPIITEDGAVVGTLSQGQPFRIPPADGGEGLVNVWMPRYNNIAYDCLATATVARSNN